MTPFSKDTFGQYLTNADSTRYYSYFADALGKLKNEGTQKTLEVFEKLGNYINGHMDDSGWKDLIKNTKDMMIRCQDKMKSKREGFESFRLRIS